MRRDSARSRGQSGAKCHLSGKQLAQRLKKRDLDLLFVATDASGEGAGGAEGQHPGNQSVQVSTSRGGPREHRDGGMWPSLIRLCASTRRHSLGTRESTFHGRHQEEREMMGFQ